MSSRGKVLVVERDGADLRDLAQALRLDGYDVASTPDAEAALKGDWVDLVLLRVDGAADLVTLRRCRELAPGSEVVMISAAAAVDSAVDAMREGAFGYVAEPCDVDELRRVVAEALGRVHRRQKRPALYEKKAGEEAFLTRTPSVERLLRTTRQVAGAECQVSILGEEGTGRRALARHLHQHSPRAAQPFHLIRCSAHDPETIEAMLFGDFAPHTGTLLLEEPEALSARLQARLAMAPLPVRLLAATARDFGELVRAGQFRQDLALALGIVTLQLPPLSQRKDDIPLLAEHFLAKARGDRAIGTISGEALELLGAYDYPGNVRELETVVRGAVAVCDGPVLLAEHLPPSLRSASRQPRGGRLQTLEERERDYILWVLDQVGGNQTLAARILGIDRVSLWRKLKRFEAAEQ